MNKHHPDSLLVPDPATDHILGPASATVTLIEYGDFECPTCKEAHGAVKILLREFGKRLRFVYRHFPDTEAHPHAEKAAEAAEAVGAQGHFWPFYDLLFENQDHLKEKSLRQYADQVGADLIRYDHEMQGRIYLQRVQENSAGARRLDILAMPTFFVNGQLVDVSFGLERLDTAIAAALQANPGGARPA
jgi:protein-disulfide isomerase